MLENFTFDSRGKGVGGWGGAAGAAFSSERQLSFGSWPHPGGSALENHNICKILSERMSVSRLRGAVYR